jgi:hypothetical protein
VGIMTTACVNGQSHGLSDIVRDTTDYLHFVFPTAEDSNAAALEGNLKTLALTYPTLLDDVRDREIVIAHHDTEDGRKGAEATAQKIVERAHSIRLWAVPDYGSKFTTMKEWCAANSLVNTLELEHAAEWSGFAGFAGTQNGESPTFEGVEVRPIAVDLIPVPPLEDEMIPEPLRAWVIDIATRAWAPIEYVATAVVVAISGLIGSRIGIKPKSEDSWVVVSNLWGMVVGPPGVLKSPMVKEG